MYRFLASPCVAVVLMLSVAGLFVDAQRAPRAGSGKASAPAEKLADLYNLGPIGGRASLEMSPSRGVGSGLAIREIIEGAPGDKAGLRAGDIILGAPKDFGDNAYHELAEAIEAAEAERKAKSAVVKLTVKRGRNKKVVEVKVRHFGKDAKKFPAGKMRDTIVDESLAYLAKEQKDDGGWDIPLSGKNGRTVVTSLCGMAFLAAGHNSGSGKYKSVVLNAANFVMANAGEATTYGRSLGKGNWNQTNWGLGYGGLFLAEANKAKTIRGCKARLQEIADKICKNMESSGGFAHGPGGPNSLDYLELEIVSNYCVAALGGAIANGCDVKKGKIEAALSFIQKCGGGQGGVGYSPRKGQIGFGEPGRTGGAMMAFGAVKRSSHPYYKSMKKWLDNNLGNVVSGHVSPTMHHLSAAAASYREGGKTWDSYWENQRQECTMLRNPDSTFTARPTEESTKMGSNTDLALGTAWNTAHWTIILCLEEDNLPVWFGKAKKSSRSKSKKPEKEEKPVVTGKDDKKSKEEIEEEKRKKKKADMEKILED